MEFKERKTDIKMTEGGELREFIPGTDIKLPKIDEWDIDNLMEYFANKNLNGHYRLCIKVFKDSKFICELGDAEDTGLLFEQSKNDTLNMITSVLDLSILYTNDIDVSLLYMELELQIGFEDTELNFNLLCYKKIMIKTDEYSANDKLLLFIPINPVYNTEVELIKSEIYEWYSTNLLKYLSQSSTGDKYAYGLFSKKPTDIVPTIKKYESDYINNSSLFILNSNIIIINIPTNRINRNFTLEYNNSILFDKYLNIITPYEAIQLIIPIEPLCKYKNVKII